MPKPIDFTGFSCFVYINFLSANGIIEVPPTTTHIYGGENLWLLNIVRFL